MQIVHIQEHMLTDEREVAAAREVRNDIQRKLLPRDNNEELTNKFNIIEGFSW